MEQVFYGMIRTWLHIFLGIGILGIGIVCLYAFTKWISEFKKRFEK